MLEEIKQASSPPKLPHRYGFGQLEVIDSHKSEDIIKVLKELPLAVREGVKEVCVDMWGGFPKVIREVFPHAQTVIDRFQSYFTNRHHGFYCILYAVASIEHCIFHGANRLKTVVTVLRKPA